MNYSERVMEIAALVAAVPGAGVVHARSRMAARWGDFLRLFQDPDDQRIRGWEITRKAPVDPQPPDLIETYALRAYFGLQDAAETDLTFQAHLDDVVRLFRDTPNLSFGVVEYGVRFGTIDERMFGDVLVHYAEGELQVRLDYDLF